MVPFITEKKAGAGTSVNLDSSNDPITPVDNSEKKASVVGITTK